MVGLIFSFQKFGVLDAIMWWIGSFLFKITKFACLRIFFEEKKIKCFWLATLKIIWYFDRSVPGTSLLACLPGRYQHCTFVFLIVFVKSFLYYQQVAAALAAGCTRIFYCIFVFLFVFVLLVLIITTTGCSSSRRWVYLCVSYCTFVFVFVIENIFILVFVK